MSIEAMKQALEALETCMYPQQKQMQAMTALRQAIEQAEKQEPVAWEDVLGAIARGYTHPENERKPIDVQLAVAIAKEIQDMYTNPPQRQPHYDKTEMNCFVQNLYDQKMREGKRGHYETMFHCVHQAIKRLYTTPQPQREWVGLTDEERMDILLNLNWDKKLSHMDTALAIEAKLKEKNT